MVLYKYKSIEFIEDVIKNKRLFCSRFDNLNDPMEWAFTSDKEKSEIKKLIRETEKDSWRICCLSKSKQYGLMWSMYGDSHKGVCIEVEIDESNIAGEKAVHINEFGCAQWIWGEIKYKSSPEHIYEIKRADITGVLWTKSKQWKHEQEVRFVCRLKKNEMAAYLPVKVNAIYLGKRMSSEDVAKVIELCKDANLNYVCMNSDEAPKINYWKDCKWEDFIDETKLYKKDNEQNLSEM